MKGGRPALTHDLYLNHRLQKLGQTVIIISMRIALTIAGSDPTGGAGLQADSKVFNHFNVYGLSAVSAITDQNTYKVNAISGVDEKSLDEQLSTLLGDIRPDAIKTGMLFSIGNIKTVAKIIRGHGLQNLVVDPVTISSTGTRLIEDGALDALKEELFPLARVITPNIYEASVISGINIKNEEDTERVAAWLKQLGAETVIITGGHLDTVEGKRTREDETVELIYDGEEFYRIRGKKIKGQYHGTGCAFSAAITANLAKGETVIEAAKKAKEFVNIAIENARGIGRGMKLLKI